MLAKKSTKRAIAKTIISSIQAPFLVIAFSCFYWLIANRTVYLPLLKRT